MNAHFSNILRRLPADGESEISQRIEHHHGGKRALLKNDNALESLMLLEEKRNGTDLQRNPRVYSDPESRKQALKLLRDDLRTDVATVIKENFKTFEGKLRIQLARIEKNVGETVEHVGDRVIKTLQGGPADQITNWVRSVIC